MAVTESKVRQGTLTICGEDHSCQPTAVAIVPENTAGGAANELEVLCGDKLSEGGTSDEFAANLVFTAIQDFTNAAGLIAQSWKSNGVTCDFVWRPTSQAADEWHGKVTIQAIEVGGEVGQRLTSQVSWKITELFLPTRLGGTQVIPPPVTFVPATGVTAGIPGALVPGTATLPTNLAALKQNGVIGDSGTNKPTGAWTTGQYIVLADNSHAYWNGTAWVQGEAP